jgi:hypothetical protein
MVLDSVEPIGPQSDVADVNRSFRATQVPSPKVTDSMASLPGAANRVGKSKDSFDAISKQEPLEANGPGDELEGVEQAMRDLVEIVSKDPKDLKFEDYESLKKLLSSSLEDVKKLLPKVQGFGGTAARLYQRWGNEDVSRSEANATQLRIDQVTRIQPPKAGEVHGQKPKSGRDSH